MTNLEDLIITRNYHQAKFLYLEMKIRKLQLARVSRSESDTDYKKTITNDAIIIQPDTDVESSESENESENECEDDITIFVKNKLVKDDNFKLKRTECYICYKKYCELQKLKPKPKPQFFKAIEKILGQPTKTNGIYFYKNYSLIKSDPLLTFNESVEEFIF